MNIFPIAWNALKAWSKNISLRKISFSSEITKLILSIVLGIVVFNLLQSYYTVPYKEYRVVVHNTLNARATDDMHLSININSDEDVTRKTRTDFVPGVFLEIEPHDSVSPAYWANSGMVDGQYGVLAVSKMINGKTLLEYTYGTARTLDTLNAKFDKAPFIDSIRVVYAIHCDEFQIPNANYRKTMDGSEVADTIKDYHTIYRYKEKLDTSFSSITAYYTKISLNKDSKSIRHFLADSYVAITDTIKSSMVPVAGTTALTSFNLLSKYDLSQCNYRFVVDLPYDSKNHSIKIDLGGATDFSSMHPAPDIVTMSGIIFNKKEKIRVLSDIGLRFHAKFSQLESIQMIRLFFVTTILGFLAGLFFSSLWNLFRLLMKRVAFKKSTKKRI